MKGLTAFYPTKDLQATRAFYEGVLGFEVWMDQGSAILYDTGYGYLGFCYYDPPRTCEHVCISFNQSSVSSVDAAYETLSKSLSKITSPAWHPLYPVYSFFFQDNNDYTLEIQFIRQSNQ